MKPRYNRCIVTTRFRFGKSPDDEVEHENELRLFGVGETGLAVPPVIPSIARYGGLTRARAYHTSMGRHCSYDLTWTVVQPPSLNR